MLTLEQFRKRIGFSPWHFWQLADTTIAPMTGCNTIISEYQWQQSQNGSRQSVRDAMARAANKLKADLGYPVIREQVSDRLSFRQPASIRQQFARSQDSRGRFINSRTNLGWVRTTGLMTIAEVSTEALSFTDTDGDSTDDAALITSVFPYPASEAALYLPSSEWRDGVIGEAWRVEPYWLRVSGNTLTAQVPRWLLVKRALYESSNGTALPIDASTFVDSLVVARRYVDTTTQGFFVWESQPGEPCNNGDDPSQLTRQIARYVVRDERDGYIAGETSEYDTTNLHWHSSGWTLGRQPDYLEVNYIAGRDDDEIINEAHYLLTCAELAYGLCGCAASHLELSKWTDDIALMNDDRSYSSEDLGNPFGTRRGQIEAWKMVKNLRRVEASVIVR